MNQPFKDITFIYSCFARDPDTRTGKLCFPDGRLCQNRNDDDDDGYGDANDDVKD